MFQLFPEIFDVIKKHERKNLSDFYIHFYSVIGLQTLDDLSFIINIG
jgi:hypothetical protein